MYLKPHGEQSIARVVDFDSTKGGLVLAASSVKNVTVFFKIDRVGPDVKRCKPGDIVLAQQIGHAYMRDGTHYVIIDDKFILATVEDIDMATVSIEGEKKPEKAA